MAPAVLVSGPRAAESYIRLHSPKSEHMIRCATELDSTRRLFSRNTTRAYPLLMKRTPYSCAPYGPMPFHPCSVPVTTLSGPVNIFVYQDSVAASCLKERFSRCTPHIPEKKQRRRMLTRALIPTTPLSGF